MYQQPQSYADMFAQAKQELFKQTDTYWKRKSEEFEAEFFSKYKFQNKEPSKQYQLVLSEEEYYYLSCILGHLVPAGEISKSLLGKVSLDDLDCEDFDRVSLSCTEIKLNENN